MKENSTQTLMVSNVVTDNSLCRVRHSLSLVEHSTGLENLGAMIDGAAQVGANTSPERLCKAGGTVKRRALGGISMPQLK